MVEHFLVDLNGVWFSPLDLISLRLVEGVDVFRLQFRDGVELDIPWDGGQTTQSVMKEITKKCQKVRKSQEKDKAPVVQTGTKENFQKKDVVFAFHPDGSYGSKTYPDVDVWTLYRPDLQDSFTCSSGYLAKSGYQIVNSPM